jgi:hypothetical protein
MKVLVLMLGGDTKSFNNVDEVAFAIEPDRLIL